MVGQTVLVRLIGVRVPISQLGKIKSTKRQRGAFDFSVDGETGRESRTKSRSERSEARRGGGVDRLFAQRKELVTESLSPML